MASEASYIRRQRELIKLNKKSLAANGVYKYNGRTKIEHLEEAVKEAEELLDLLPDVDNGRATPLYQQVAELRQRNGLPPHLCQCPSEMKVNAWSHLKSARHVLAEALESKERYKEALPLYLQLVEQADKMRTEIWEPNDQKLLMMNNVALCYKRSKKYREAKEWYQRALDLCRYEDPGSQVEELLHENLYEMIDKGGGAAPSASVRACWNCASKELADGSSTKLMRCAKCRELKIATPACYCSKECQTSDWTKRHCAFHKQMRTLKKENDKDGYSFITEEQKEFLEGDNVDIAGGSEYSNMVLSAARAVNGGDKKKAAKLLKKAIRLNPQGSADAHYHLANCLYDSQNYGDAVTHYLETMRLVEEKSRKLSVEEEMWARSAASVFSMFATMSECAFMEKPEWMCDHRKLKQVAVRATQSAPSFNEGWFMLGNVHEKANERVRAIQCYRRAEQTSETERKKIFFRTMVDRVLKRQS